MNITSKFKNYCFGYLVFPLLIGTTTFGQEKPATSKVTLPPAYIVPNFHPVSCGWLTNWSTDRNYCANSYLDHLDRVRDDANYQFVLSECNNMIAIQNFVPERFEELKTQIKEGRVELPNAFFLESTINLSGPGYYRPITQERREDINKFYEQTALSMYNGFTKRMAGYAEKGDMQQKRLAALFSEAQK